VWVPILAAGSTKAFQWMEFATTLALTAAGWVVADSCRARPAPDKPAVLHASASI
jgi:hypothetical protein